MLINPRGRISRYMEFIIATIEELSSWENRERFGNKALMLSRIEKYNVNILPGFCVLIHGNEMFERDKLEGDIRFREKFTRLMGKSRNQKLIARSSGMMEDSEEHLFPGVYKSVSGIMTMQQLLDAVEECYHSQKSDKAQRYSKMVHASTMDVFCVLIQRELEPEYSGIAYTKLPFEGYWSGDCMMVQMVQGGCTLLAKGIQEGNTYVLHDRLRRWDAEKEVHHKCLNRKIAVEQAVEEPMLSALYKTGRKLVEIFNSELDVEWAYRKGKIYIFQVRPINKRNIKHKGASEITYKPDENQLIEADNDNGLKWNAMKYFWENGMFEKGVLLLDAHLSLEEIKDRLYQTKFSGGAITVRFSYKNQIGMPRAFVNGKEEAFEFIKKNWTQECALIIYEDICVQDSYEIYIDDKKTILEHVPGVWESDSKLMADSVVAYEGYTDFWRVEVSRDAKFEDYIGISKRMVPPFSRDDLMEEQGQLQVYIEKIKNLVRGQYPVNVHYVRDNRKRIYFLNLRKSRYITDFYAYGKEAYPIRCRKDFETWDRQMPLLVCPDLNRGEEILIMEMVPLLKKASVPILIDFGILSHPAIMLREMGINVTPRFMCHDYFRVNKELDRGGNCDEQSVFDENYL